MDTEFYDPEPSKRSNKNKRINIDSSSTLKEPSKVASFENSFVEKLFGENELDIMVARGLFV